MIDWVTEAPNILSGEANERVRKACDQGEIVVQHMYFFGGRALSTHVFHDYEDFEEYLKREAKPGDQFVVFDLEDLWEKKLYAVKAKFPNSEGKVPVGGSY
jgi:hypothetical protein